jgi:CysZ protein
MIFDKKGKNPMLAIGYLIKGFKLLVSPGLRKFLAIPIFINFVLYSAALYIGYYYLGEVINQFIPSWLQWLRWLLWPLFFISFFIIGFFTFTVLANLLAAPFYGKLSAKTLAVVTGQNDVMTDPPLTKVMVAELKRAAYFGSRALPLVILSIIPGVNFIAPFLWALFSAWGMALEYMAYPLENRGVLFSEQRRLIKTIRVGALSFGGLAAIGLTVPLFNILVAPAAVIGATIYMNDVGKNES